MERTVNDKVPGPERGDSRTQPYMPWRAAAHRQR
jgi:hypothetical protein